MVGTSCRFCKVPLQETFVDLGLSPLANSYVKEEQRHLGEYFFPLHAYVCTECYLVQLEEYQKPENIFAEYAYFSSYAQSWLKHAKEYASRMIEDLSLNSQSMVIEIASNDGYLLQYFKELGIPVLGIEPAKNVAEEALKKGISTVVDFFGKDFAEQFATDSKKADLLIGNNVLAHVPDLNDFVAGMKIILKPNGIITMEFPHLLCLIKNNQFDTIYHEHFSYFSFSTVQKIFAFHGLTIFDVEEIATHGGSIRIYAMHSENNSIQSMSSIEELLKKEEIFGMTDISTYSIFPEEVKAIKRNILIFFIDAKNAGKQIVGYGAPAKGNTLLNYCGIRTDILDYTVDRNPYKQGLYLPGTHIPIKSPDEIARTKPDYVVIFPWNLQEEIVEQMAYIREWGGEFIVLIPTLKVI